MPIRKADARKIEPMPWPQVAAHVTGLAESLDSLLATIQVRFERNDRNLALFSLGVRAMHETRRAAVHVEDDLAELAWSVRNLHEIDLILRYLIQREEHLAEWHSQVLSDEKDVIQGFLTLEELVPARDRAQFEERLGPIHELSTRFGLEFKGHWTMRKLARASNREQEYDVFYKFLSKFVHPTSWLVNRRKEVTNAIGYRNLLIGLVQVLARRIYGILFDNYSLDEADLPSCAHSKPWVQAK